MGNPVKYKMFSLLPHTHSFKLASAHVSRKKKRPVTKLLPKLKTKSKVQAKTTVVKTSVKAKDYIALAASVSALSVQKNKQKIATVETTAEKVKTTESADAQHVERMIKDVGDFDKRFLLKMLGGAGVGLVAASLFPKKADALVVGSTPTSSVVGVKDSSNIRISPATEESLLSLISGQGVTKLTTSLSVSGTIHTPASGKKIRVYSNRFSLTADAASVSFRFTAVGTDHEKYISPKTGGLYGANNHPNFVEGGVDEVLYCVITGTTTVQINIDYLEI